MPKTRKAPRRRRPAARVTSGRPARRARRPAAKPLAGIFPAACAGRGSAVGLGAFIAVAEAFGTGVDSKVSRKQVFLCGRRAATLATTTLERTARRFTRGDLEPLAQVLAALGSSHRLSMMACLLEGPATYRSLQRRTGLQAGPLYHHINQLRLANVIGPKSRDTYALTRAGRNALLVALALGPLLDDSRQRPGPH